MSSSLRPLLLEGDLPALRARAAAGGSFELDDASLSALMVAAGAGHPDVVAFLLERGAPVTERRANAFTALHAAAMGGHTEVAALLLAAGADPDAQTDPQRYSPLHSAAFGGHDATVALLLAHGALAGRRNYRSERPEETALRTGQVATAELLRAALHGPGGNPRVTGLAWGSIEAGGETFKDARLFPGGAAAWDWGRTGTRHRPGTQFADVEDLLEHRPDTVILSRGVDLVLQVPEATVQAVQARGPRVLVLQSQQAVRAYNRLAGEERVVALVHSTC